MVSLLQVKDNHSTLVKGNRIVKIFNISKKIACGAFLSLLIASGSTFASGLTASGVITEISPGSASIRVSGLTGNPDSCTRANLFVLEYNNARYKELYAGLLTAYASGNNVRLFVNGCVNDGPLNLASIKSVILQ